MAGGYESLVWAVTGSDKFENDKNYLFLHFDHANLVKCICRLFLCNIWHLYISWKLSSRGIPF